MKKDIGCYVANSVQLAKIRRGKSWTQGQAAEKFGISLHYYCRIENGKDSPGEELRNKIAKIFQIKQHELFTWTPKIIDFIRSKNKKDTLEFIEKNPDRVDDKDSNNNSPLHIAVSLRYCDETKLLLNMDADIFHQNHDGSTFFLVACKSGYSDVLETILSECKHGDIEKLIFSFPDHNGNTPFLWAAREGRVEICKRIIKWLEDNYDDSIEIKNKLIEARNRKNKTPLMRAAGFGDVKMVELLLKHNADIAKIDHRRRTAMDIAVENGHARIANFIEGYKKGDNKQKPEKNEKSETITLKNDMLVRFESSLIAMKKEIETIIRILPTNNIPGSSMSRRLLSGAQVTDDQHADNSADRP